MLTLPQADRVPRAGAGGITGDYFRVRRLVVTSAELVWRNAKTNFNGKVVKGMNEKFLEVGDVMQILGISRSAAYKLMRQINSELEKKGYIVIRGKVSRKYFEERIYGMSDAG